MEADMAMVAAETMRQKARAELEAMEASNFATASQMESCLSLQAEATFAEEDAIALRAKAIAELQAAAATKASISVTSIVALALVALVAVVWLGIKAWQYYRDMQTQAAQAALKVKLSHEEVAQAMDRLYDATEKTRDALAKLNEEKDRSVERSRVLIEAMKAEADAQANLAEAKKKGKLLEIELAEKTGKISKTEAIRQRGEVEKQDIRDKAKAKSDSLSDIAQRAYDDSQTAAKKAKEDQAAAQVASDKVNNSPEGIANAQRLAQLEKIKKNNLREADEAEDARAKATPGSKEWKRQDSAVQLHSGFANLADDEIKNLKANMKPDEQALADALRKAGESKSAADSLKDNSNKASMESSVYEKNYKNQVAADVGNVDKQTKIDELGQRKGPDGLNQMQRLGAFTAQGGNPLVELGKTANQTAAQALATLKAIEAHQKLVAAVAANEQGGVRH